MKVGHIIKVHHNERIPADLVLLYTTEKSGGVFIRTDQLDGETDWKLRKAVTHTQIVHQESDIVLRMEGGHVVANPPSDQIYDFKGYYECNGQREGLSLENTIWTNTVLASTGHILGLVVYTGIETRSMMNARDANTKVGKLDLELNRMSKFLFSVMVVISLLVTALDSFQG